MTFTVSVSGSTAAAAERELPGLLEHHVASRLAAGDSTLWGPDAEAEASIRLGWFAASEKSRALVEPILQLRDELRARGLTRIVLSGMGGSSLAPEMITQTAGVELVVLDSTHPVQVSRVVSESIDSTVLVVSSKSGSTSETDSHKRLFEQSFVDAGIDPASRIIIVTDPGSPLDVAASEAGYRVFNADPTVGGRYSALTAFGLVPSGLAGVDISALLDEADSITSALAEDSVDNPGLVLGAAMAGTSPRRDKMVVTAARSSIVGVGDWIEQLVAESTGKNLTGVLPVAPSENYPAASGSDIFEVAVADSAVDAPVDGVSVAGALGAQILVWEFATAVAGRILGVNPFDQPDVESAKIAARAFLENPVVDSTVEAIDGDVRISTVGLTSDASTVSAAISSLIESLADDGYLSIHAYADRKTRVPLPHVQGVLARTTGRAVTFGWAPRFLHSTGQYHKGGPAQGVFLQIIDESGPDVDVPGRPFTFGSLMSAQASGDAKVLSAHGRPVVTFRVSGDAGLRQILTAVEALS